MSISRLRVMIAGIAVEIVRKDIKNLHLGVYPPDGRVRVAVPLTVNDDAVRLAVIGKFGWIKRQRARFQAQPRQSEREMVNGESHYYLGRRYRLRIVEASGPCRVEMRGKTIFSLCIRKETTTEQRTAALQQWHRQQMQPLIPPLVQKWEPRLGVQVAEWRIKRMKTKWGSCTPAARRIWLNLELIKKPPQCLEYIVVHEMMHLLEKRHNERFIALMDQHLPQWRALRNQLNAAPLSHESWDY